jgi:glycyl-tRNA synthetase
MGNADRTQYDLNQHQKFSGVNMKFNDQISKKKYVPYVASEPSVGIGRIFTMVLADSIIQEKERIVLKISPKLAAYKIAVFPLMNKPELSKIARKVHDKLRTGFSSFYDDGGSIGRRYRRQDEIGTPYCITIDYQTIKDKTVTVRERDSMKQKRVKISELKEYISKKLQ